ncbi:hypothetical protein [Mesorhizobium sp.]|uniref:hypothetical protein n=1 Tax=Mesorhizobium sp. TaxID=1871066 RepID=UPI00121A96E9|nr:hypothetical protein [Mesorhizobium sp.]TIP10639.1 MAG: hypothetical protein E5X73_21620 [Mesorhizobium sp.]
MSPSAFGPVPKAEALRRTRHEKARSPTLQTERTPDGEQALIPGVRPITTRDRLALLMDAPMRPRAAQKPLDIGLFDLGARNQLDLF